MAERYIKHCIRKFITRNRFLLLLVFLISACFFSCTIKDKTYADDLDSAQISDLYSQAKEFFRQANSKSISASEAMSLYKKSAMRYERLIKEGGIENGMIYYNLGNIYFRMNDIGRAILNYRRAEQYIPNDTNLKQNLNYARGKRIDTIEEKQETKVLKTLFFWHYDFSVKTRIMLFTLFFAIIWICAGFRVFFKRPFLFWCMTVSIMISILFSGSLIAEEFILKKTRPGVILSQETTARKGNSETYEPSFKEPLHAGTEFTLIEERGEWYQIELPDSRTCWVSSYDVELVR
jgi:tetratricopeptide (TPR) repeat protein